MPVPEVALSAPSEVKGVPAIVAIGSAVRKGFSGSLRFQTDKFVRQIFFSEGRVSGAMSNARNETPAGYLQKLGRLTESQVTGYLAELKTSKGSPWGPIQKLTPFPMEELPKITGEHALFVGSLVGSPACSEIRVQPGAAWIGPSGSVPGVRLLIVAASSMTREQIVTLSPDLKPLNALRLEAGIAKTGDQLPLEPEERGLLTVISTNETIGDVLTSTFIKEERVFSLLLAYWLAGWIVLESAGDVTRRKHEGALTGKEKDLRDEIVASHARLDVSTYYDLIGVNPGSLPNDLDSIVRAKIERYSSPVVDRIFLPGDRPMVSRLLAALAEARDVLTHVAQRNDYDRFLASGKTGSFRAQSSVVLETEVLRATETLLKDGNLADALRQLEAAVSSAPQSAKLAVALASTYLRESGERPESRRDRAIAELKRALTLDPKSSEAYEVFGAWLEALQQTPKAIEAYRKALQLSPISPRGRERITQLDPANAKRWILDAIHSSIGRLTLYELIGADPKASPRAIQEAYRACTREFHPDRFFQTNDASLQALSIEVFKRMTDAYMVLKHADKRKSYDESLNDRTKDLPIPTSSPPEHSRPDLPKTPQGKKFLDHALAALRAGKINTAKLNLQLGLQIEPNSLALREKLDEVSKIPNPYNE